MGEAHETERLATDVARPRTERVTLIVHHNDGVSAIMLRPGERVVIGRDASADLSVADQSLSRAHAAFSCSSDGIAIEDLGSTNGSAVNDVAVAGRALVRPGDRVRLGALVAEVLVAGWDPAGLDRYDALVAALDLEVVRSAYFARTFAVVVARSTTADAAAWASTRARLRPVDRMALYGPGWLAFLVPEIDAQAACALAGSLGALAGVAMFPASARSPGGLLERARAACLAATTGAPVQLAEPIKATHALHPFGPEDGPVIESRAMRDLLDVARRVAASAQPVVISGETGAGKEIVARVLHEASPRASRPLVAINCGAIPPGLVAATLLGHERGAFTGAQADTPGAFEAVSGGTLFLDEIAELSPEGQAVLLRVLETRRVMRVGSTREIAVDARVIAATNRDLGALAREGKFRQDLLYRLDVVGLEVPPLRERPDDIAPLARRFLAAAVAAPPAIEADALGLLERYGWPGNVRELRNVIERAILLSRGGAIGPLDLPERVRGASPLPAQDVMPELDLRAALEAHERKLIMEALRATGWDRREAARRLRLPLRTLAFKMRAFGVKREAYG